VEPVGGGGQVGQLVGGQAQVGGGRVGLHLGDRLGPGMATTFGWWTTQARATWAGVAWWARPARAGPTAPARPGAGSRPRRAVSGPDPAGGGVGGVLGGQHPLGERAVGDDQAAGGGRVRQQPALGRRVSRL
jgi:hypothetical protein